jgi:hypothetical protein
MVPKQPYVEVPYVLEEEAPMERRVVEEEEVVWYRKPAVMPLLVLIVCIVVAYFVYQMYKSSHPADGDLAVDQKSSSVTGNSIPSEPMVSSSAGASSNGPASDAPKSDSMPVQPPAGKAYAGSGHLELYRQGNITYQYNTDSGETCVMYASLREWRNPIVYRNACR